MSRFCFILNYWYWYWYWIFNTLIFGIILAGTGFISVDLVISIVFLGN